MQFRICDRVSVRAVAGALAIAAGAPALAFDAETRLLAGDGQSGDQFATALAISGDTAIVGAPREDDRGSNAGAAYIYERVSGAWTQRTKLTLPDGRAGDNFGGAVAISDGWIAIGAPVRNARGAASGSVTLYRKDGASWTRAAEIVGTDTDDSDYFGSTVALRGGTLIVGAYRASVGGDLAGAAYVFNLIGGNWVQTQRLAPSDQAPLDAFGWSIGYDGTSLVISSPNSAINGEFSGTVYVFERVVGLWTERARIAPASGAPNDRFGYRVALLGTRLVATAIADDSRALDGGAAYVYRRESNGAWVQEVKLTASDGAPLDAFGQSATFASGRLVLGASADDDRGTESGSAYVFSRSGTSWRQEAKLTATDGRAGDRFAGAVAADGTALIIGAVGIDERGTDSGGLYIFRDDTCIADFNGDGSVDSDDFLDFTNAFYSGDAAADINNDGRVDSDDYFDFLTLFNTGC